MPNRIGQIPMLRHHEGVDLFQEVRLRPEAHDPSDGFLSHGRNCKPCLQGSQELS